MPVQIGLRDLYYALLNSDPVDGVADYEVPVRIAGLIQANINPNPSSDTLFADDGPMETASTLGEIELQLGVSDLPLDVQAVMLGHSIVGGVMLEKAGDVPPWMAIGFRSLKSNGKYRYTWLTKGKFQQPEQNNETKNNQVNFQTPKITGKFVKRDSDDLWKKITDEDHVDFVPATGTNWFNAVEGAVDDVAPAVTISPVDEADTIAVDSNVVVTFDKVMTYSTLTADNIFIVDTATGAKVAAALSIDAARKVVTLNPAVNLSTLTEYTVVVTTAVKGLNGVNLADPSVTQFTTAA